MGKKAKQSGRAIKRRDPATLAVAVNLTIGDVEALTGFPHKRVYGLIADGSLQTYRVGRRRYVSRRALDICLAALEQACATAA